MRRIIAAVLTAAFLTVGAAEKARADQAVNAIALAGGALLAWSLFADPPKDNMDDQLLVGGGWFDIVDQEDESGETRVEFRPGLNLWKFRPMAGVAGTIDGAFYAYAGLRLDVFFGKRILVSPNVSPTLYIPGDGKDLGSNGVLRSGLDIQYRFDDDSRIGVSFHHMSHGKVFGSNNPGTEVAAITYSIPLNKIFGN